MGDAAPEDDRVVGREARRPALRIGVAALAVDDDVGDASQAADLGDAGHHAAVPNDAELEVLVRVEAVRIHGELGHVESPGCTAAKSGHCRRVSRSTMIEITGLSPAASDTLGPPGGSMGRCMPHRIWA
jgi:hypothetical protein